MRIIVKMELLVNGGKQWKVEISFFNKNWLEMFG